MSRSALIICFFLIIFVLSGCGEKGVDTQTNINSADITVDSDTVHTFSYSADSDYLDKDLSGVRADGFENTTVSPINNASEAVERAKKDCIVEYDAVEVSFDSEFNYWRVDFYTKGMDGGNQSVYLNSDGITLYSVCGE